MQTDNAGNSTGIIAGLLVTAALDAYLREHAWVEAAAPERQEYGSRHLKRLLGTDALGMIDIPACREYARARRGEGAANSTIRRELNILTAAANHAKRWRRVAADQMPQIELPKPVESEQVSWLTKDQIASMFRAANKGHFACFLRLAYYTAGRRRSIQNLKKTQIDLPGGRIHLAVPGERVTKKRRPTVPLYPEVRPAIDWLLENSGTPYLFGRPRDFYKPFSQLCERLSIEAHPHMLRHSRATHMLMDGESIYKVAKLLGDTVATVEKVYGHSSVDFLTTHSNVEGAGMGA